MTAVPCCVPQVPLADQPEHVDIDVEDHELEDEDDDRPCPLAGLDVAFAAQVGDEDERAARATVAEVPQLALICVSTAHYAYCSGGLAHAGLIGRAQEHLGKCVFSRVKTLLVAHLDGRQKIIDVCPCGFTVYHNPISRDLAGADYKNAHQTQCPRPQCGMSRYLPGIMPLTPRKVRYYIKLTPTVITAV